jgi:hypothetical protein
MDWFELLNAFLMGIGALFWIGVLIFSVWLAVRIKRYREEWAIALAWLIGMFVATAVIAMLLPVDWVISAD